MSLSELSHKLEIPKSTMFKLLHTMVAEGFLERNKESGKYRPGCRTISLSNTVLANSQFSRLAYPHLKSLASRTGLVAHLTCYGHGEVIWLMKVEDENQPPLYSRVGRRAPAYAPASGKAILAYLDAEQIDKLVGYRWKTLTPKTNTDKDKFLRDISFTKQNGFSFQREEVDLGVASLAVPILDDKQKPVAGISVAGYEPYFNKTRMQDICALLKHTAREVAQYI